MRNLIEKIKSGDHLTAEEMNLAMKSIMSGEASEDMMADFLLSLRAKGPTIDEITAAAKVMREFVVPIKTKHKRLLDTCGTGGDKLHTFNISTITALVVAAAGVAVAKHGNRSVSSKCGSADILEALGVNLDIDQDHISACLNEVGIAFLFAQKLHPAMKNVAPVRKKLGVETIFNILGPLTNPAKATHQVLGVYNNEYVAPMAEVLKNLGVQRAIVVHGGDGLDEITTTGKTFISEYDGKNVISYDITPDELWIKPATIADLKGGDLEDNVAIANDILTGGEGPKRDIVVVNAAYALYVSEEVKSISEGLDVAIETIDKGKAHKKLEELVSFTNRI